jgi:hypothetical protein
MATDEGQTLGLRQQSNKVFVPVGFVAPQVMIHMQDCEFRLELTRQAIQEMKQRNRIRTP